MTNIWVMIIHNASPPLLIPANVEAEAWLNTYAIDLDQRWSIDLCGMAVAAEAIEDYLTRIEY